MEQGKEMPVTEEVRASSFGEKSETRSSHVRITQPSKDLNRYLVDKFHLSTAKYKSVPFESIDLSIYKPSTKCLAFSISENRLLLWIAALQHRYYEITGNAADYKVIWEEQDSPSSNSKCDKITIHLISNTPNGEEKLVAITVFVTTGRILVRGKKFEEWSRFEFPTLLHIVNTLNEKQLPSASSLTLVEDLSLFRTSLQNFFTNFIQFAGDDEVLLPSKLKNDDESLTPSSIKLNVSPTRLKTIASMRDTLGKLESDFTEFKIISAGDLEQLKDKTVQHDKVIKLQKQSCEDLSIQITSLQEKNSEQSQIIKSLQEENKSLRKTQAQITQSNQVLRETQKSLRAEINLVKEQMTMILKHSADAAQLETPEIEETNANSIENAEPSGTKSQTHETPNIETNIKVTPNIPTGNRFSLLQDCETDTPSNRRSEMSIEHDTDIVPEENKTNDIPLSTKSIATPTVTKTVVFLCDSNGQYIDTRKLFLPTQEFSYFRCPKIELVNTILNDVENQKSGHPQVIIIHCGTNDLITTTPVEDFISNISASISQASIKFPKSKII